MKRQANIEIFVRDCPVSELLAWAATRIGPLGEPQVGDELHIYPSAVGPVVVTEGMADGTFTSLCFNSARTPWVTDVDCARQAARDLGRVVRCDPGEHFPQVDPLSSVFLEIADGRETLLPWP